ncbi:hypothetical protein Plhal304r1_c027g0091071 [Plasmopara halstedii]
MFETLKNYVVGRVLTDLTCNPPSCTKTSTTALNRRPSLRVCCVMFRTSSASTDTYRLLPGSTNAASATTGKGARLE